MSAKRSSQKRSHHKPVTVQQKLDHIIQMLNVEMRRDAREIKALRSRLALFQKIIANYGEVRGK